MKKLFLVMSLCLSLGVIGGQTARADIFHPVGASEKLKATESLAIPGVDPSTLLGEFSQALGYLSPKVGGLLDKHGYTDYLSATVITYEPYGLALNIGTTNIVPDGYAATIDWNFGKYIPAANVPLLQYITSGTIGAGVDYRHTDKSKSDPTQVWDTSWAVTAQVKTTF